MQYEQTDDDRTTTAYEMKLLHMIFHKNKHTQAHSVNACFVMMNLNSTNKYQQQVHSFFDQFKHIYRYDMMSTIIYNCRILWNWRFSSLRDGVILNWKKTKAHADDTVTCTCELKKKLKEPSSLSLSSSQPSLLSCAVRGVWGENSFTVVGFPRIAKSIKLISYLKIDAVTRFVHFHMTLLISSL